MLYDVLQQRLYTLYCREQRLTEKTYCRNAKAQMTEVTAVQHVIAYLSRSEEMCF